MTIREVIEMLKSIFEAIMEYFGPLFSGEKEEADGETTEET